mgnify:CR=1 FL=1
MRLTLVAYEDLQAGDLVAVTPGSAGRVQKVKITAGFEPATAVGMAQNTAATGNTVVITTDGPSNPNVYGGALVPGTDYYIGIAAQLVTYSQLKSALQSGGYDHGYLCHVGVAASTDQIGVDLEPPVYVIPSAL